MLKDASVSYNGINWRNNSREQWGGGFRSFMSRVTQTISYLLQCWLDVKDIHYSNHLSFAVLTSYNSPIYLAFYEKFLRQLNLFIDLTRHNRFAYFIQVLLIMGPDGLVVRALTDTFSLCRLVKWCNLGGNVAKSEHWTFRKMWIFFFFFFFAKDNYSIYTLWGQWSGNTHANLSSKEVCTYQCIRSNCEY